MDRTFSIFKIVRRRPRNRHGEISTRGIRRIERTGNQLTIFIFSNSQKNVTCAGNLIDVDGRFCIGNVKRTVVERDRRGVENHSGFLFRRGIDVNGRPARNNGVIHETAPREVPLSPVRHREFEVRNIPRKGNSIQFNILNAGIRSVFILDTVRLISPSCPRRFGRRQVQVHIGIDNVAAVLRITRRSGSFKDDVTNDRHLIGSNVGIDVDDAVTASINGVSTLQVNRIARGEFDSTIRKCHHRLIVSDDRNVGGSDIDLCGFFRTFWVVIVGKTVLGIGLSQNPNVVGNNGDGILRLNIDRGVLIGRINGSCAHPLYTVGCRSKLSGTVKKHCLSVFAPDIDRVDLTAVF